MEQAGKPAKDVISLGYSLESIGDVPPPLSPLTWTDSKQKQREARKKLVQVHKLQSEQVQDWEQQR